MKIPRNEHPNPQWKRNQWENLNGTWEFEIDYGKSGRDRKLYEKELLSGSIIVPFCPESKLSGVAHKDFMQAVWYRRTFIINPKQKEGRTILHFGAVDYKAYVYINGQEIGTHQGGYSSFSFDITDHITNGKNVLVLCAEDDVRSAMQPRGKQCETYYSKGCDYTRTTGIWQTVWLEFTPKSYLQSAKYYPDIQSASVTIHAKAEGSGTLLAKASYLGKEMGTASVYTAGGDIHLTLSLKESHLWEAGHGRLYDLELVFQDDLVYSYFGLRNLRLSGLKFLINEKSVFQRLVLDQGFYPDGIYTAPTEEDLIKDIEISLAAGFNGARLHQKMVEPLFLYHCDRLGYLVWGEHASWGLDHSKEGALAAFLPEWAEGVERDFNHPAIIGWCPFNETWDVKGRRQIDDTIAIVYQMTKAIDSTRPCIDTSGNFHVKTDIFDLHNYDQDPDVFKAAYESMDKGILMDHQSHRQTYQGEPCFVSEYGGIKWDTAGSQEGWGYGNAPKTEDEFMRRYELLTSTLLDNENFFGFCYTQLYDVEQELNGLYSYSRKQKFDLTRIRTVNLKKAAIESD